MAKSAKPWISNWEELEPIGKGGQGRTLLVRRRDGTPSDLRVLKVLNRQDDLERRARMHREVAALETIDHPCVPKLIDSNAGSFRDTSIPLYMVMERVDGPTLEKLVDEHGPLPVRDAAVLTLNLLDAVGACHHAGLVHRDIKPDNVIVAQSGSAHLVDWGLSYNVDSPGSLETGSKEIGNRFLHLPELQEGDQKRLQVSDLTQTVGILFYAITGRIPRVLTDAQGRRPHQRGEVAEAILSLESQQRNRLLRIFDQGFDTVIERRFGSASSLAGAIAQLANEPEEEPAFDETRMLVDIKNRLTGSHDYADSVDLATTFGIVHDALAEVFHDLARYALDELVVHFPWGHFVDLYGTPPKFESAWGLQGKIDGRTLIKFKFEGVVVGSEIVLSGVVHHGEHGLLTDTQEDICRMSLGDMPNTEALRRPAIRQTVHQPARKFGIRHLRARGDFAR
jgi:serine/threonine protein kinase